MGFAERLDEWLRDTDLTEEELIDLGSVYGAILLDHKDLMDIADRKNITVAEAYWECKKAQKHIAERIKRMRAVKEPETR